MSYKAFISYRHSSGRHQAESLESALKQYAKPTFRRPLKIFRDEKHLAPGGDLKKSIENGLKNSEYLIFLAEKSSADSTWCQKELEEWCNPASLNRAHHLIIVLIDDEIVLNETQSINFAKSNALPNLLSKYITYIPLYVDLRWAKSATDRDLQNTRYRQAINSISARLQGLLPEDLNDEAIRVFRRNIRFLYGAIAVLVVMLLVAVGAAWWAVKQQEIAEANELEAEKQQKQAEENLLAKIEEEKQKERLNFDKYVSSGDVFANSGDFSIALRYYQKADSLLRFSDDSLLQLKKKDFILKYNTVLLKRN